MLGDWVARKEGIMEKSEETLGGDRYVHYLNYGDGFMTYIYVYIYMFTYMLKLVIHFKYV